MARNTSFSKRRITVKTKNGIETSVAVEAKGSPLWTANINAIQIKNNDKRIWFSQLYGMSDHISFNLAINRYNVTKYLPFGPIKQVIPYLIRRLDENTSVSGQTSRELKLISKELKRRRLESDN